LIFDIAFLLFPLMAANKAARTAAAFRPGEIHAVLLSVSAGILRGISNPSPPSKRNASGVAGRALANAKLWNAWIGDGSASRSDLRIDGS
jgi:hypothetical protein